MPKKFVISLISFVLGLILCACSGGQTSIPTNPPLPTAQSQTEAATQAPEIVPTPSQTLAPVSSPSAIPTVQATSLPATITDPKGVPMALVPAGPFTMGVNPDEALAECQKIYYAPTACDRKFYEDSEPAHTVTLDDFYIDVYEVTNSRYAECVGAGACTIPSNKSSYSRGDYYTSPDYADYPVIFVSWEQARAYCEWRGGRLPTEAEWEKAARGTDGRFYPWGNTFDGTKANYCDKNCVKGWRDTKNDDGYPEIAAVGSYPQGVSPFGIFDMAGNVQEWVADWRDPFYFATSPAQNPIGPEAGGGRVLRGGAWFSPADFLLTFNRDPAAPEFQENTTGFRCVRAP
jgi:formylglycine-generating enzyme required for sulfatase activity